MKTAITRVMATVAADRCSDLRSVLRALRDAGADGFRINSAHATVESLAGFVAACRDIDPAICILMDTKGPEMRTTAVDRPLSFAPGDMTTVVSSSDETSVAGRICVAVAGLHRYVAVADRILFDDGLIAAEIVAIDPDGTLQVRIVRGGVLGSRKTVAFSNGIVPPLPAVSQRDALFIRAAVECGVDIIAHSFVRSADDIRALRSLIGHSPVRLFAKIECREALANIDGIMAESDGILVARGDLGTALPLCELPSVQIAVMRRCRAAGKPAIVSTQILQSMIDSPIPTRAEVSDVALAVMEGADMLLLCGETAEGRYPCECIDVMRRTILSTEAAGLRDIL